MASTVPGRSRISQKVAVGVVYVAVMVMTLMDVTIVNVALPSIGRDFSVKPTSVGTVTIAYLVSLAVFIPASGWLGDRFGGKRVLLCATAVFTAASALCGAATSLPQIAAFRILQGAGGGMLVPVGMAMLYRVFPPEERVRAIAFLTIPMATAPAVGPIVGGLLVTELSWPWVFYVNIPIGLAALLFGVAFVEHSVQSKPGRFDLPGFLLAGVGLGLVMYGMSEGPNVGWSSVDVLAAVASGIVLLAAMVVVELRTHAPIVALKLFENRLFRYGNLVLLVVSIAGLGVTFISVLYFQDGRGLSPLQSGLSSFPSAVGGLVGAQTCSRVLYPRLGPRRLTAAGIGDMAVSIALMAMLGAHTSLWWARVFLFVMGFGMGTASVAGQAATFATISAADTSRATTLFHALRQLGGAIGVALFTTCVVLVGASHRVGGHVTVNFTAYRITFLAAAATGLCGAIVALRIDDAAAAKTIVDRRRSQPPAATSATPAAVEL